MKTGFSSDLVNLNYHSPNRNRYESVYYWEELYTLISAAGFKYLEMGYNPKWDFGRSGIPLVNRSINLVYGGFDNYLELLHKSGIEGILSVSFDPNMFCSGNMDMYFGIIGFLAPQAIEYAKSAGAEVFTMTATPTYYNVKKCCPEGTDFAKFEEEFLTKTAALVEELAKKAEAAGVKMCIRNDYWTLLRGNKVADFVKKLNAKVYIDADTANLQAAGVCPAEFIKENIADIGLVHFSDTDFVDDQEAYLQPLPEFPAKKATKVFKDMGKGTVDFVKVYEALKEGGYEGNIICNARNSYDQCRSLLRARRYLQTKLNQL
jgi:inosose dehydratase